MPLAHIDIFVKAYNVVCYFSIKIRSKSFLVYSVIGIQIICFNFFNTLTYSRYFFSWINLRFSPAISSSFNYYFKRRNLVKNTDVDCGVGLQSFDNTGLGWSKAIQTQISNLDEDSTVCTWWVCVTAINYVEEINIHASWGKGTVN